MNTQEFSRRELLREPTTLYRWLQGISPIPKVVVTWLLENCKIEAEGLQDQSEADWERLQTLLSELEDE